ncbi:MAG: hypothetical protein GY773_33035 [Actinomycetia bacterium]|nr:hypothetical protein [Actinomycetes bacterium]
MVWLVVTALLLIAFQSVGVPRALGDEGDTTADSTASDYPLVGADPSEEALPSVLYAGVMWSLVDVRVTPTEELLGRALIEVDVTMTNTLAVTALRASDRLVTLKTDDGETVISGHFDDAGPRLTIEPGQTLAVTIVFSTGHDQDPDPASLTMEITEPNRVPASIPLAGAEPELQIPVFAAVDSTATALQDPDDASRQVVVEPQAATLDINGGPYRAALGEQLVLVKVLVQRSAASESSGYLDTSFWALQADGASLAPLVVSRTAQPASNADEVTLLFAFSVDAEGLALQAGLGGPEPASFALVAPAS